MSAAITTDVPRWRVEEGSGVFVSVPKSCDFFPLDLISELRMVPYVYKGLDELLPGLSSNFHSEAKEDLQKCQVFVLVRPLSPRGRFADSTWGYAELDILSRVGMNGLLYLPLVEKISETQDRTGEILLPAYATIRNAPDCGSLNKMLEEDLTALLKRDHDSGPASKD